MLRPIIALATAAFLTLALAPTDASARPGGGGFRGGGFSGFHGGFRGGGFHGFRGGYGFRRFGPALGVGIGLGLAGAAAYPWYYGGYGYPSYYGGYGYPSYAYADGCLAPRRVWTPYGWRVRWVNICY